MSSNHISGTWYILVIAIVLILAAIFWPSPAYAQSTDCGIVTYEWNGLVNERPSRGFPREQPPRNNFNWVSPTNYAAGEMFFRVEVFDQPAAQDMKLQLCFWQPGTEDPIGNFDNEECGVPTNLLYAETGQTVATWSEAVADFWNLPGGPIDWTRERFRAGVAIKTLTGAPVSDYNGWDWNGQDPDDWYPLDMHFMGVLVPPNGEFCGWDYYLTTTSVTMESFDVQAAGDLWRAPLLMVALLLLVSSAVLIANRIIRSEH